MNLHRIRWGVRAVLALGVAASVAANILHAEPHLISQMIAAWPPLALLLNVELISRVPVHRRYRAILRLVTTAAIAGIAAWVSYWHMAAVAARYGETGAAPYLLPFSVDGLVVVASVCLVELAGRIRDQEDPSSPSPTPETKHLPAGNGEVLHGAGTTRRPPPPPYPPAVTATSVPATSVPDSSVPDSSVPGPDSSGPGTVPVPAPEPVPSRAGTAAVPAQVRGRAGKGDAAVSAELLARAQAAAEAYLAEHGKQITRDELRKELGTRTDVASALLRRVRQERRNGRPTVPARANGRVPATSVAG